MPTVSNARGRARWTTIVAASAVGHVAVLLLLGLTGPRPPVIGRNEPPVTPIEIWTPPPVVAAQRQPRSVATPTPATPRRSRLIAPPIGVQALPPGLAPGVDTPPAPRPASPQGDLRRALRGSTVGCANRDTVGLTRREREACDDSFGRRSVQTADIAAPIDPAKRAAWNALAARREIARRRKEDPVPTGIDPTGNAGGTRTTGIGILGY